MKVSWGCVARRTIVSEPPTSTAPTNWANGARQPSERKWKEPSVPGASLDRVGIRAGTVGPHLLLRQMRGARGRADHRPGGSVEKAMHCCRLS